MKHILIILLTLRSLVVYGQTGPDPYRPAELRGWVGFLGNPFERTVTLTDTSSNLSVAAYEVNKYRLLQPDQQPTVTRVGRQVTIRWANTKVLGVGEYWVQVKLGALVKLAGPLVINQTPVTGTPTSLTVANYIVATPGSSASLVKFYTLENVNSGHVLPHSGASRLLIGDCYPDDQKLADPLWKVEAFDDNTCVLRGPPNETFSGTVVVTIFQKQSN